MNFVLVSSRRSCGDPSPPGLERESEPSHKDSQSDSLSGTPLRCLSLLHRLTPTVADKSAPAEKELVRRLTQFRESSIVGYISLRVSSTQLRVWRGLGPQGPTACPRKLLRPGLQAMKRQYGCRTTRVR